MKINDLEILASQLLAADRTTRYDGPETMMFARELEHIRQVAYETVYASNVLLGMIPMSTESYSPADQKFTYRQIDSVGEARELSLYGSDEFPSSDIVGAEFTRSFVSIGSSFAYNIQEMRAAAKLGRPLDALRAASAKRAVEQKMDQMMAVGSVDSSLNAITGLFNAPNVGNGTLDSVGVWSGKTAEQIVRDIDAVRSQIRLGTKGAFNANVLLLSQSRFEELSKKRTTLTTGAIGMSAIEYIRAAMPDLQVQFSARMDDIGSHGMLFPYNPEVLWSVTSQQFEVFAPQMDGMLMKSMCHARGGGVVVRIPSACKYLVI